MKNYKFIVPVFLVAIFILSIFKLYDSRGKKEDEYYKYLKLAQAKREEGIYIDAKAYYSQALSVKPSLNLYEEIGEFYLEYEEEDAAIEWGEEIINQYPYENAGYEFLFKIYDRNEDYIVAYSLVDKLKKRKVESDYIDNRMSELQYVYYFKGEYISVGAFNNGLCPVKSETSWGYVNSTGAKVIESKYSQAGSFFSGVAPVVDMEGNAYFINEEGYKKNNIYTIENAKGFTFVYDNLFAANDNGQWGFYNIENYEYVFGKYDEATSIGNGLAAVRNGTVWTIINEKGEEVSDAKYEAVVADERGVIYRNDRIFVKDTSGYYMINSKGEKVGNDVYEDVDMFRSSDYAAVKKNDSWYFIDKDGNIIFENKFDGARSFSNGYAAVKINDKWGFIDKEGNIVIEQLFDGAMDFNEKGCVYVNDGGIWTLLILIKDNH